MYAAGNQSPLCSFMNRLKTLAYLLSTYTRHRRIKYWGQKPSHLRHRQAMSRCDYRRYRKCRDSLTVTSPQLPGDVRASTTPGPQTGLLTLNHSLHLSRHKGFARKKIVPLSRATRSCKPPRPKTHFTTRSHLRLTSLQLLPVNGSLLEIPSSLVPSRRMSHRMT